MSSFQQRLKAKFPFYVGFTISDSIPFSDRESTETMNETIVCLVNKINFQIFSGSFIILERMKAHMTIKTLRQI
jgi:hypothetical protein